MLYSLARPLLFCLDPERAHNVTLNMLDMAHHIGLLNVLYDKKNKPGTCMGLTFTNPVGLAAGLDKNAAHIDALAALGFGFIEVGTVTPRPQEGNPQPRLFRLPSVQGIINRMGFNNAGVDVMIKNIEKSKYNGILGINIGKNAITPVENAVDDYLICMNKVYAHASYITMNISSPNTKGLRSLQTGDALSTLLESCKNRQAQLASQHGKYVPLVLKVAPDLEIADIEFISAQLLKYEIDGLIATNTTLSRTGIEHLPQSSEMGGLSGAPVKQKSDQALKDFAIHLNDKIPLIGVGGICSGNDARDKINAGATMVQLYSGLIYTGPTLVRDCVNAIT